MTDKLLRGKRRSDRREFVINLISGFVFYVCLAGATAEKSGYIGGERFTNALDWILWALIVCVWLLIAFIAWAGRNQLDTLWNDQTELLKMSHGIGAALKKLRWFSFVTFAGFMALAVYVGHIFTAAILALSVAMIIFATVIIVRVGKHRAAML